MIQTAEGIVLRRYPFRETSITLSCLTDRFGKLNGIVKGIRTQPNRYRSAMEPLTINRIVFYDTRASTLHLISQCELLNPLTALQRNLDTMQLVAPCIELIEAIIPLEEPQPLSYQLLKHTLERFTVGGSDGLTVRLHFMVRLLRLAGFRPQLDACARCGRHIATQGCWSAHAGGLLCQGCRAEDPHAEFIPSGMLEALEHLAEADQPPVLDAGLLPLLTHKVEAFLAWRLDRPLKTLTTRRAHRVPVEATLT